MAFKFGIQSAQLKQFNIKVKGKWLNPSSIKSFSFTYGIDELSMRGELVFLDQTNLSELIVYGDKIEISLTNFNNEQFIHSFLILHGSYKRDAQGYVVTSLFFEDPISVQLKKLYPIKGFDTPKNMVEIITDVDTAKGPLKSKQDDFTPPSLKFPTFVVPRNKSFYWTIEYLKRKSDVLIFQTQKKIKIKKLKELVSKGPKQTYYYRANNEMSEKSFYDFTLNYVNEQDNIVYTQNLKADYFNPEKKEYQKTQTSFKKTTGEFPFQTVAPKFSTSEKEIFATDVFYKDHLHNLYSLKTAENFQLEILCFPTFKVEVGDIVKVSFPSLIDAASPEMNIDGKWLIKRKTISIFGTSIVEKMNLIRAKSNPVHHPS